MPKPFCPLIPFAQLASDELLEHWAVSLMRIALVHDELLPNGAFYDRVGKIVVPAALSDNIISIFTLSNVRIVDGKHSHLHDLAMWDEIQSTWVSQEGAQTLCRTLGFSIATWPRWLKPSLSSIFVEKLPGEKTARRVLKVFRPVFFPKYGIKMYPLRGPPRRIVPPSSVIEDGDGPVSGESSDGDSPALSVHGNGDEKDQDLVGQALAGTGRIVDRDLRGTLERLGQALKNSATDASDELSCSATPIADGYAEELELPPSVNGPLIPREILPAIIEELERALLPTTEEHVRALARLIVRSYCSDAFDNTEGYVDDLVQQLSEFPADIVESAMRGGG